MRKQDGPLISTALAAGAKTKVTQDPIVIIENVPDFPRWLAEQSYGRGYEFEQTFQNPGQVGFEMMARNRS